MAGVNSWPLLAVPLFILVGIVASRSEIADRLYDAAVLLLGPLRAGLAYVNIVVSVVFSWMSGAALADAASIGAIEVDHMRKKGYPAEFSVGLSGVSALISPIMPPSIPAIVYASVATVSVGALFAASVIPAFLLAAALAVMVFLWARKREDLRTDSFSWARLVRTFLHAAAAMLTPVVIIGGILGGFFTPTEAAAVGAVYMIILGFAYRKVRLRDLVGVFRDTVMTTGSITIIWRRRRCWADLAGAGAAGHRQRDLRSRQQGRSLLVNVILLLLGMIICRRRRG